MQSLREQWIRDGRSCRESVPVEWWLLDVLFRGELCPANSNALPVRSATTVESTGSAVPTTAGSMRLPESAGRTESDVASATAVPTSTGVPAAAPISTGTTRVPATTSGSPFAAVPVDLSPSARTATTGAATTYPTTTVADILGLLSYFGAYCFSKAAEYAAASGR